MYETAAVAFSRAHRIAEFLEQTETHSVAASCTLQVDMVSVPAQRLVQLAQHIATDDKVVSAAPQLLSGWGGKLATDSAAAALSEV